MYKILFLELYKDDLQSTLGYISNMLCSPDAAKNFYGNIKRVCKQIAKNPFIFSSYLGNAKLSANYRKAKVGNYYIFFEIDELLKIVKIKRLVYAKMDSQHILKIIYS